jgi:hypothetical protein
MPNSGNIATISGNTLTNSSIDLSTKADLVDGKIPSSQLPSYVDDILEYTNLAGFPATGSSGLIYVAQDTNKIYRWSGSAYVEISPSPGSTDSVAEGSTNLYFTNDRARAAISLTTTGTSGAATYSGGVLNIPQYQPAGSYLTAESDTLATVTGRGASTNTAVTINNDFTVTNGRINAYTGGSNTYGLFSGYSNSNHLITLRGNITGPTATPTITAGHQTCFVEYAEANDTTGWFFKSSQTTNYTEVARITRVGATFAGTISSGGTINSGDSITMGGELYYGGVTTNRKVRMYSSGAEGSATLNYSFWTGSAWSIVSTLTSGGTVNFTGSISAYNLSGTNTGDQTLSGLGGVPTSRTITINGVAQDLSANRSWSVGTVVGIGGLSDANASSATTNGGFYAGFNPTNVPSGLSSLDIGLINFPIWQGNGAGERYSVQLLANLDANDNIYIRKFFYNGTSISRSAWHIILNSSNYSSYALPLSGGTMTGDITMSGLNRGIYFTGGNNRIYFSGYRALEGSTTGANLQVGEGYAQIQLQSATTLFSGKIDQQYDSFLNRIKYTQGNYRVYRNLARFDNYGNGTGAIAITTNIPWNAANMLTIQVKGYTYGGNGPFDITFSVYAGEGNFYSPGYIATSENTFAGVYYWARNASDKVVLILGNTTGSYGAQVWVSEYKQGFGGQDTTYADGWTISKITSTTGLSTITSIPNKNNIGGIFNGGSITGTSVYSSGQVQLYAGSAGNSPGLYFGGETSNASAKGIYLESYWMVLQGHYNEGYRFRYVNGIGGTTEAMTLKYNNTTINTKITYTDTTYMTGSPSHGFRFNSANDAYNNVIMRDNGSMEVRGSLIAGSVGSTPQATIQAVGGLRWSSGGNSYYTYSDMDGGGLYIETVDNNTSRAKMRLQTRVNNSGNYVQYQLDADNNRFYWEGGGAARATLGSISGTFTVSGDVVAYGSPSDSRLKTIKEKVPNALDKVMQLNGYRFDWKEVSDITNIKEDVGVIAQEVAEVLPELARSNQDGIMSVRYQGLTAVLIEAVKELAAENKELKEILKRNNIQ